MSSSAADTFRRVVELVKNASARTEAESSAHKTFRETSVPKSVVHIPGFVDIAKTGVIYVTSRAADFGFSYENLEWANLGQGAPETGLIEGQPPREMKVSFSPFNCEYAPVGGEKALRSKIATLYNHRYRQGKASQYTAENVCICPGGRAALARIAACVGDVNVGYFLPDYTAYEQLLSVFKSFVPIPNSLNSETGYNLDEKILTREIEGRGLQVILNSNPGNPTGALSENEDLAKIVRIAREKHCAFILDEFYSHYIYTHGEDQLGRTVSAAEFVENVDEDPIIIVDGLTKNWRLPGWRICWAIGPKAVISSMQSAGSFLDGGANHPLQDALLHSNLLDPDFVLQDTIALQKEFRAKRDYVVGRLTAMGLKLDFEPHGTFYAWVNLEDLPPPLNNGMTFYEALLPYKVIVVPGIFFDVNPGKRRELFNSPYHHYVRISFGPSMPFLQLGMDAIARLLEDYHASPHHNH